MNCISKSDAIDYRSSNRIHTQSKSYDTDSVFNLSNLHFDDAIKGNKSGDWYHWVGYCYCSE